MLLYAEFATAEKLEQDLMADFTTSASQKSS